MVQEARINDSAGPQLLQFRRTADDGATVVINQGDILAAIGDHQIHVEDRLILGIDQIDPSTVVIDGAVPVG